jgi:predicted RNase H-like nuclease (RuvC/YqgF family)
MALKKTIKDLKIEMAGKDDEIMEMKKTLKYTKIREMEIETKAYAEEVIRLKAILDNEFRQRNDATATHGNINTLEEKYYQQSGMIDSLKKDNTELAAGIKMLQDDLNNLHALKELQIKLMGKKEAEIVRLRKVIKDREADIEELKKDLAQINIGIEVKRKEKEKE